jgi:hypothetical protein
MVKIVSVMMAANGGEAMAVALRVATISGTKTKWLLQDAGTANISTETA